LVFLASSNAAKYSECLKEFFLYVSYSAKLEKVNNTKAILLTPSWGKKYP
jgi:hypothetical protein